MNGGPFILHKDVKPVQGIASPSRSRKRAMIQDEDDENSDISESMSALLEVRNLVWPFAGSIISSFVLGTLVGTESVG